MKRYCTKGFCFLKKHELRQTGEKMPDYYCPVCNEKYFVDCIEPINPEVPKNTDWKSKAYVPQKHRVTTPLSHVNSFYYLQIEEDRKQIEEKIKEQQQLELEYKQITEGLEKFFNKEFEMSAFNIIFKEEEEIGIREKEDVDGILYSHTIDLGKKYIKEIIEEEYKYPSRYKNIQERMALAKKQKEEVIEQEEDLYKKMAERVDKVFEHFYDREFYKNVDKEIINQFLYYYNFNEVGATKDEIEDALNRLYFYYDDERYVPHPYDRQKVLSKIKHLEAYLNKRESEWKVNKLIYGYKPNPIKLITGGDCS